MCSAVLCCTCCFMSHVERHISVDPHELKMAVKNRLELADRTQFDDLTKLMEGVANFDFFDLKQRWVACLHAQTDRQTDDSRVPGERQRRDVCNQAGVAARTSEATAIFCGVPRFAHTAVPCCNLWEPTE